MARRTPEAPRWPRALAHSAQCSPERGPAATAHRNRTRPADDIFGGSSGVGAGAPVPRTPASRGGADPGSATSGGQARLTPTSRPCQHALDAHVILQELQVEAL
ncbi:hypothetical protein ON010_g18086 [Phytophthora cinnamomi]|nr:hypothetical protein ON010_g18086 [Phytophthora cinnamomi]